jgi:hypothetical protein
MRVSGRWIEDSTPGLVYTLFQHAGLLLSRVVFAPGQWQTMFYESEFSFPEMTTVHIQTKGTLRDVDGIMPDRPEGWINREDDQVCPGGYRKRQAVDWVELWCVRNRFGDTCDHVEPLRLAKGMQHELKRGESWMHVAGTVDADGERLAAPAYIAGPRSLRMMTDGYAFRWMGEEVPKLETPIPKNKTRPRQLIPGNPHAMMLARGGATPANPDGKSADQKDENEI